MSFHDVQFPTNISMGSKGGPGHNTAVIETAGGHEERVSRWANPRHSYDAKWGIREPAAYAQVKTFAMARKGATYGFRYKDWLDFTSAADFISAHGFEDVNIGTGDGSTTTFQLVKKYTSGPATATRPIERPVTGQVRIGLSGVEQMSGWSVDYATGIVTFSTAPTLSAAVTAGFQFDVPCRFGVEVDKILDATISAFRIQDVPSIPIVEIRATGQINDEVPWGGHYNFGAITANVSISAALGRLIRYAPGVGSLVAYLPSPADYPPGPDHFVLMNGGANDITLKVGGTTVATHRAGKTACVCSIGNAWEVYENS